MSNPHESKSNKNSNRGRNNSGKENWSEDGAKRFINPYNFVPFESKCNRQPLTAYMTGDTFTGIVHCTLKVKTPVIITDSINKSMTANEVAEHKFFSYDAKTPVIPGSELRGMLRSVHEAAFNGCLSSFDAERKLHRRSIRPKQAGVLYKENGIWFLSVCKGRTGKEKAKNREEAESRPEGSYYQGGYLHKGEFFGDTEPTYFIFRPSNNSKIMIENKEIEKLQRLLKQYADPKINKNLKPDGKHTGYAEYTELLNSMLRGEASDAQRLPVYYSEYRGGGAANLSPAAMSKEVFDTELADLLPYEKSHEPCNHKDSLCPSCAMFGMISSQANGSSASRVRIADALPIQQTQKVKQDYFMHRILLPEMGEPRPGAVEFYTDYSKRDQQKDVFWTSDYKIKGTSKEGRVPINSSDLSLRGRKFYWHHEGWKVQKNNYFDKNIHNKEMVQWVHPISVDGPMYEFRIYFEKLTVKELNELLWTIDYQDKQCAHKIGRGKPLGFGSIQLQVQNVQKREINLDTGEWELNNLVLDRHIENEAISAIKSLKTIANWANKPDYRDVSYPLGEDTSQLKDNKVNATASHQWFRGNQSNGLFNKVLPKIEEEIDDKKNEENKWLYKVRKK